MDEDREEFEKRIGTTLRGKWKLERLLGIGGMAAVYASTHKIGRKDAIKILHPEVARSKDLRARFEREAHAVNSFVHPGVVEIRDIDTTEDGAPFLVMELLEGEPLSEMTARLGGLDPPELLRIVDDLLDVLAAAHDRGIIHRDVKLDNLFMLRDGRLKVLDFGIARMRDGVKTSMRTQAGATLGTLSYMAPEQVRGLSVDHRADLFAVGATMFRVVAKRRLQDARTESELLVKMATMPAPSLGAVAPGASQALRMIVDRALAFDRESRYPDARTMQGDVRAARRGELPPYAAARLAAGDLPGAGAPAAPAAGAPAGAAGVAPTRVDRTEDDVAGAAPAGAPAATGMEPTAAAGNVGTELTFGGVPATSGVPQGAATELSLAAAPAGASLPGAPPSLARSHASMPGAPPSLARSHASLPGAPPSIAMPQVQGPQSAALAKPGAPAPHPAAHGQRSSRTPVIIAAAGAALTLLLVVVAAVALSGDDAPAAETPPIPLPVANGDPAAPTPMQPSLDTADTPAAPGAQPTQRTSPASPATKPAPLFPTSLPRPSDPPKKSVDWPPRKGNK